MKRVLGAVAGLGMALGLASPAWSVVTQFAAFGAAPGTDTLNFLYTSGSTPTAQAVTTSTGTTISDYTRSTVSFTYSVNGISSTPILAYMTIALTGGRATTGTGIPTTNPLPITGKITFTPVSDGVIGTTAYTTSSNLLTANLYSSSTAPGTLTRMGANMMLSGDTGTYADDPADYDANSVIFTSDFLTFDNSFGNERAVSLTGSDARAVSATQFLTSSIGTFSSDPAPTATVASSAVPESATWAMMLVGFGAVGMGLRGGRSRKAGLFA